MNNLRLGVRIPEKLRKRMQQAIDSGKGNNLSGITRTALEKFLDEGEN
jgi:Arc/MetJ-type ribon-helix-helix transcriptional regulator